MKTKRGYCGIGIESPKTAANVGTLWRSAYSLGADFMFTIGKRCKKQASDTLKAYRHIPYFEYETHEDFKKSIPYSCQVVGVELFPISEQLETFKHPERAIYLLGPEDGSISLKAQEVCHKFVKFTSAFCLNVSAAGSVVLYDRNSKMGG